MAEPALARTTTGSRREPLVAMAERRLGGPVGEHASLRGPWFAAVPWTFLLATFSWLILMVRMWPCRQADATKPINAFYRMCYSDISVLYQSRQLAYGTSPYGLEQPPLAGFFVSVMRTLSGLVGAPLGRGITAQQALTSANIFLAVNALVLFVCFLVLVWAQVRTTPGRPFDALMVAGAPVIIATGLISWDLLAVMLVALGFLAWRRRREGLAGVAWGLAIATRTYPVFLLVPLLALALRTGRVRGLGKAVVSGVVTWAVPNAIIFAVSPASWKRYWAYEASRGADLGSIWYVLGLMGVKIGALTTIQTLLLVLGLLAIAALALLAPRRPRLGQLAFLTILWVALTQKGYPPQTALWLVPLLALARPRWHEWLLWSLAEVAYFCSVWGHLAGTMYASGTRDDRIYWAAVILRVGVELWLAIQVVLDALHPEEDPLRADGQDDPHGGEFDRAPDAPWVASLAATVLGRRPSVDPRSPRTGSTAADVVADARPVAPSAPLTTPGRGATAVADSRWRVDSPGRLLLQAWVGSRGLLLGVVLLSVIVLKRDTVTKSIAQWDVLHFYDIAREGYRDLTDPAFFPGLPLLLRGAHAVGIPYTVAGLVISAVCSFLAALALMRLGGRAAGPWAAMLWLIAPTAIFTFVPYTESLFCALAFWAWERARAGRWWQMALLAAAACTVRVSGLFLVGALFILIVTRAREPRPVDGAPARLDLTRRVAPTPWLVLPMLALFAYAAYGRATYGSWTAWYTAQQSGWAREFHWPWEALANTWTAILPGAYADHPGWVWIFRAEFLSMIIGIVATVLLLLRRRWAEAAWIGVQCLAFSLSYWWMSVPRAVLLWFPLWILLGEWMSARTTPAGQRRRGLVAGIGIGVSLIVMCMWAYVYCIGWWAS